MVAPVFVLTHRRRFEKLRRGESEAEEEEGRGGRSPNPAGHGRRSSIFGEIIPTDKDPMLLALGYSGGGLKSLLNLSRGAPDRPSRRHRTWTGSAALTTCSG
ncbi:hypothetical protein U1Q18_049437 [Sarracenia purpurea var. burkii]